MKLYYTHPIPGFIVFLLGFSFAVIHPLAAQNVPDLTQTAPAGNITVIGTVPEPGMNYGYSNNVIIRTPFIPFSNEGSIYSASDNDVKVSALLKDGFNRTYASFVQNNAKVNNQFKDLVQVSDNRVGRDKHSFLPYAQNHISNITNGVLFQTQKAWYQTNYPDEGYTSYSTQKYYSDAATREMQNYAAGKSGTGQNRMARQARVTDTANEVRLWGLNSSGNPVSNTFYKAGTLYGMKTRDPQNPDYPDFINYSDNEGKAILKKVLDSTYMQIIGDVAYTRYRFQSTYYVYDETGRLCYILPPKATEAIENNNWTVTTTVRDNLCFQYQYDSLGRQSALRKPGEAGFTYIVYDRKQRPVLRQTPNEKAAGKWEVTFYDKRGRAIATSLFNNTSTAATWQGIFDNYAGTTYSTNNIRYYILTDAGEGVYPAENAISGNAMMSYTYYDDYRIIDPSDNLYNDCISNLAFSETLSTPGAETPSRSFRTQGLITGSKIRMLPAPDADTAKTGDWRQSITWYDDKGRATYSVRNDLYHGNAIHTHYTGSQYDFTGRSLISKHVFVNNNSADGAVLHTELTKNIYEAATGKLLETDHLVDPINGGIWNILAKYQYDDLGRIKKEILGNAGEQRDYDYNIRGQVTGINAAYAETGALGGYSKSFGESLKYDYGMTDPRYDGKIAGMVWRGAGGTNARMMAYGYDYDLAGRMKSANFSRWEPNGPIGFFGWSHSAADRSLDRLFYDKNGNILSMRQRADRAIQASPYSLGVTIDSLSYSYEPFSNKLSAVSDGIDTNYNIGDFQDGNTSGADYAYDVNGNLTKDLNKGITSITYTHFNKPQTINFSNGNKISYSYDASGSKVQEIIKEGASTKKMDYLGNFIYQSDSLQYALTGQGRTIWQTNGTTKEDFFVKDHLGNVRSVIDVYQWPILIYLGTYELASANLENLFFEHHSEIRDTKPASIDSTDAEAGRLNGADPDRQIGTAILMRVMAGDKLELNVNTYYDAYDRIHDVPVSAEDMLANIVSTLTGGEGGLGGSESHNPALVSTLFTSTNYTNAEHWMHDGADPSKPKAFLNYILFDQGMHPVHTFTGAFQATGNGSWTGIGTTEPMVIPINGYLAVYLDNKTRVTGCTPCGDVFFDNLVIRFNRGQLKEESHYYPFGLPMGDMGSTAAGFKPNRHKYQSNEYIQEAGLNWMDFHFRQYDQQLGRFVSVDPLAASFDNQSPFTAMNNNPVSSIDPWGLGIHDNNMLAEVVITGTRDESSNGGGDQGGIGNGLGYIGDAPYMHVSWGGGAGAHFSAGGGGGGGANGHGWNFAPNYANAFYLTPLQILDQPLPLPTDLASENSGDKGYYANTDGLTGDGALNSNLDIPTESGVSDWLNSIAIGISLADYGREGLDFVSKQGGTIRYLSTMTNTTVAETRWSVGLLNPAFTVAGKGLFGVGIGISGYQGYMALRNGNYGLATKNGLDIGVSTYGFFGGTVGLSFGAVYFAIDAFYPGGWPAAMEFNYNLTMQNRAVIPGFNLFRDF